jgi:hypothetical protein
MFQSIWPSSEGHLGNYSYYYELLYYELLTTMNQIKLNTFIYNSTHIKILYKNIV